MAKLAILGHATRGKEVIEILEMLGGYNHYNLSGKNGIDTVGYHIGQIIPNIATIKWQNKHKYIIFTLEEFLEKFPYKVGDKVINKNYKQIFEILSVRWCAESNTIMYQTSNGWYSVHGLKPYKKETMEERENSIVVNNEYKQLKVHSLRFDKTQLMINDEYELKQEGNAYYIIRRKPQYPKTYEECCKVLGYSGNYNMILTTDVDNKLFNALYRLKICRDAYWKIAGEQMGLGKPWEPNFKNEIYSYNIVNINDNIRFRDAFEGYNYILAFPTEEMRDAFYENFKELIEECKELL